MLQAGGAGSGKAAVITERLQVYLRKPLSAAYRSGLDSLLPQSGAFPLDETGGMGFNKKVSGRLLGDPLSQNVLDR